MLPSASLTLAAFAAARRTISFRVTCRGVKRDKDWGTPKGLLPWPFVVVESKADTPWSDSRQMAIIEVMATML